MFIGAIKSGFSFVGPFLYFYIFLVLLASVFPLEFSHSLLCWRDPLKVRRIIVSLGGADSRRTKSRCSVNSIIYYVVLGHVWSSGVFRTLKISKRESQLPTAIITSCHYGEFSSSKKCVWSPRKSIQKVIQKNQNNYYEKNIVTYIPTLI